MIVGLLLFLIFALVFTTIQTLLLRKEGSDSKTYAKEQLENLKKGRHFQEFVLRKQIKLKKYGADIFVRDGILVSQWYLYKALFASVAGVITFVLSVKVFHADAGYIITAAVTAFAWFFLDLYLSMENKQSNEAMMPDICEMSRSVLYGKRGGQYIIDAIKDACIVVENKRLKMGMIKLRSNLDAGRNLEESLNEFEMSFTTPEIASFCTVIKSLQTTGHVEEALKTLENNIERGQAGVNKRKCIVLENKTMVYVLLIAFDLLIMILYCIIMKLLDMQIAF
ncbi:MAG: type II secretion system F family protein [Butyrivibrio sp.]|uniref:type II secretion system F family protein n=1 Tax=Pseudobutyrivibrio sp. AR14 TaxID=1520804 RepID=UPI00088ECEBD|nr:type II secretion system F family protein [Pseudobutyrivibrio sp. AR14]MBQ6407653.1 type II secretion system F family protein [Butyrivibrio sp.]SCY25301.1 Type II secretion system (T2SS), protein F [Pseudobutyrivibrio sp. AR14]